jgi:hypothetical protein
LRRFGPAWCQITPVPSATSAASQPISVLGPGGPPTTKYSSPMPSASATNGTSWRVLRRPRFGSVGSTAQNTA